MPDHVTSCSNSPRTSGFILWKYLCFSTAPGDLVPCNFSDPISYDHALVHSRLYFIESSDSASNKLGIPPSQTIFISHPFLAGVLFSQIYPSCSLASFKSLFQRSLLSEVLSCPPSNMELWIPILAVLYFSHMICYMSFPLCACVCVWHVSPIYVLESHKLLFLNGQRLSVSKL